MSRRRPTNNLLKRTLFVSLAVNAVLLPVLAQLGVIKKVQESLAPATVVLVAPPQDEEKPKVEEKKKDAQKPKPNPTTSKSSNAGKANETRTRSLNPNAPKVVTAQGDGNGPGGSGPVVESGSGKAGEIPTGPPAKNERVDSNSKSTEILAPRSEPKSEPKEPEKRPEPAPKPEPKPAVIQAEVESNPLPEIPDDLREDALEKSVVLSVVVDADGAPRKVEVDRSCGVSKLDDLAKSAAKKWKFRPATVGGKPTSSTVRVTMEFFVE